MQNVRDVSNRVARGLMSGYRAIELYDKTKTYDVLARHGILRSRADILYFAGPEVLDSIERATKLLSKVFLDYPIDALSKKLQNVLLDVKDLAVTLQGAQESLANGVYRAASDLSALGEWEVICAIAGLDMSEGAFSVGQCQFFQLDEPTFSLWAKRCATGLYNPPKTAPILASWYDYEDELINHSVASIRIRAADTNHARWLAKVRLEESLNLLRYSQSTTVGFDHAFPEIRLGDIKNRGFELSFRLDASGSSTNTTLGSATGTRYSLNKSAPGWTTLDAILAKDRMDRTEIEDRVLTSLEWFGNASLAKADPVRLVSLATALEAMLILKGESRGKKKKLRERTAWILGTTSQERDTLEADVDRFYSMRSECVHGGETQVKQENLTRYSSLVGQCLGAIVANSPFSTFQNLREIVDWVDAKNAQQSP